MPNAPKRSCTFPGCPAYAEYRGKCMAHAKQTQSNTTERGYGHDWQKLRALKLATNGVCEIRTHCQGAVATEVDHRIPFTGMADPLRLEWSNLRSACKPCNSARGGGRGVEKGSEATRVTVGTSCTSATTF